MGILVTERRGIIGYSFTCGGLALLSLFGEAVATMVFMRVLRKSSYFSRFQVRTSHRHHWGPDHRSGFTA